MQTLVTGGAGFIGSNLVDRLLAGGHTVRVLDDLFTGFRENISPSAEFFEGNVADEALVRDAVAGCEVVFHQAAHKAVQRSVEAPLTTDMANTHGTLTVLKAALDAGVRRVVYASSSSVYGGAEVVPTPESQVLMPRSPYAVSKLAAEHYCRVFAELYGLETVALRYFNVYGRRQRPDSTYAAVIPLFIDALLSGHRPTVHGDGGQSRDFTYIEDVVDANLAAATAPADVCAGKAYNVAGGDETSLLDLLAALGRILEVVPEPNFAPPRAGDVRRSRGDGAAATRDLGFTCRVPLDEGLRATVDWLRTR
ncbi:MAG: nucleoside-diphosphate-sugar epimerase [Actinomycetia bacterium]|nr:nucleoside-diphosphate-sugar epimerase [Actinomycetes bacterium]